MAGINDILDAELALILGLQTHFDLSNQAIVALFTNVHRTINHNSVRAIRDRDPLPYGRRYPAPASQQQCQEYLDTVSYLDLVPRQRAMAAIMQRRSWRFSYRFHPVGQGLFSSGQLARQGRPDFVWVYDCGTAHMTKSPPRRTALKAEIDELVAMTPSTSRRPRLDLATISLFAEDHVGGFLDLLDKVDIGTLLIPYLTPWQRLLVVIEQRADIGSDLFNFLQAPAAFLLARGEGRIGQIVMVQGVEPGSLPDGPAVPERGPEPDELEGDDLIFDAAKPPQEDQDDCLGSDAGLFAANVHTLPPGAAITLNRLWEFVPYNDAALRHLATPGFKQFAQRHVDRLRDPASRPDSRRYSLRVLIWIYDRRFKTARAKSISADRRNRISLFLYAGPIGDVQLIDATETRIGHELFDWALGPSSLLISENRFGLMMTGDGFLYSRRETTAFIDFFTPHGRLARAGILQVMHHGASRNCRFGLGAMLHPAVSIFSSNPNESPYHPHKAVLREFAPYCPKQVDRRDGWRVDGYYCYL